MTKFWVSIICSVFIFVKRKLLPWLQKLWNLGNLVWLNGFLLVKTSEMYVLLVQFAYSGPKCHLVRLRQKCFCSHDCYTSKKVLSSICISWVYQLDWIIIMQVWNIIDLLHNNDLLSKHYAWKVQTIHLNYVLYKRINFNYICQNCWYKYNM